MKKLKLIGVNILLNTKVDIDDSGIFYQHDNKKFFLTKEDRVFFCNSPVNILKSTLSADHRVLDGAVAGKFLKDFNDIIENPYSLWLSSSDMEVI